MSRRPPVDWEAIQQRWISLWDEKRIFEADPHPTREAFFLTVAYPYPNSPQHIGHGRTYTLTDVYARYLRMKGVNVLFPMAFHYTGTPVLAMAKRMMEKDPELIDAFTRIYRVPGEMLEKFEDPINIANYFHQEIKRGMREMGYSIDWRREFTTIDPPYSKFIEWQFQVLRDKGLISQGSHPVGWCPNCGNPVGQHDTVGDVEPRIDEFTLLKFNLDGIAVPCGTLRPETVFGVTNLWINPDALYVEVIVDGQDWAVSKVSERKLQFLGRDVKEKREFKGSELVGRDVKNPATNTYIPVLPAPFVDPGNVTGIVMSVPAHAPYDFQALKDLKENSEELKRYHLESKKVEAITPIVMIGSEAYDGIPAEEAVLKKGISSQDDPRLEDATEEVYSREFHSGVMLENTGKYKGQPVSQAKEQVKDELTNSGEADTMYEIINKPVTCRCGAECIVKVFENQWFINYSDEKWKHLASECLDGMAITPPELRHEFEYTIGWLKEKACARKEGLGTKVPWDREWTIESLSDSVIYMAYYTIARHLRGIDARKLKQGVFDYIFQGKGDPVKISSEVDISKHLLEEMHREFHYFYPLDSRHSGRDLIPNHLTFFIFNHASIFPRELWPKQIVVNGSVLMEGKKMSKSFGNIIPLRDGVSRYGSDALRLSILSTAGLLQDVNFSPELARSLKTRLEFLYQTAREITSKGIQEATSHSLLLPERWLYSRLNQAIREATAALDEMQVRDAIQICFYQLDQDIQWYRRFVSVDTSEARQKTVQKVLFDILKTRARLMAPFTPFICEEIWRMLGGDRFVSTAPWPTFTPEKIDREDVEAVALIQNLLDDTFSIMKALPTKPRKVRFYTASRWKRTVYKKALEASQKGQIKVGDLLRGALANPEAKAAGKITVNYVKHIVKEIEEAPADQKTTRLKVIGLDETAILKEALLFYERELKADVKVYSEEDGGKDDPKGRAALAQPFRPAIYLE